MQCSVERLWLIPLELIHLDAESEALFSSKSQEYLTHTNFIDPLLAKNDESSNSILTEDMESAQGGLPNQDAKNSLLNKEISKVALKFTIAGISNIKKYAIHNSWL